PLAEFLLHWLPGGPGLPGSPRPFSSSSFLFVSCSTCGTTCRRCLFRLVSCSTRRTTCRRCLFRFVSCSARCAACCRCFLRFSCCPARRTACRCRRLFHFFAPSKQIQK